MKRILLPIFILSLLVGSLKAQVNMDTPNLSFEDNSLSLTHWSRYTGYYYLNPSDSLYYYSNWTPSNSTTRFAFCNYIIDPIVACNLFRTPGNNINAVRIGVPKTMEGYKKFEGAAAEKLSYRFKVTDNTTLLTYKLAAVLNTPNDDVHNGEMLPTFEITIDIKDKNGNYYSLPCSNYSTRAYFGNPQLIRNSKDCNGSTASTPESYVYQPWITGNVDLSNYVGDSATINIINHDCLSARSGSI